jgi:hypothetical protein
MLLGLLLVVADIQKQGKRDDRTQENDTQAETIQIGTQILADQMTVLWSPV